MRISIRLLAIITLMSVSTIAYTQSFSFLAGANYSTVHIHSGQNGYTHLPNDHAETYGYHLGVIADYSILNNYSFETGLLLTKKGYRVRVSYITIPPHFNFDIRNKITPIYLEIPLTIKRTFQFKLIELQINAGAYFSMGTGGTFKTKDLSIESSKYLSRGIKWGIRNDLNRYDNGLTIGMGVNFKSILLTFSYDHGMSNILPDNRTIVLKNRSYRLSLGYNLGEL